MSKKSLSTFYVYDELCSVDILQIKEVIQDVRPYPIPLAPPVVKGLINLRGGLITIIDLRVCLGLPPQEPPESGTCIVLKTDSELESLLYSGMPVEFLGTDPVGLIVDKMGDVLDVNAGDIHPPPGNLTDKRAPLVKGVVKFDDKLVSILSLERLLSL